jgi:ActR/RegA family two-component response regulator
LALSPRDEAAAIGVRAAPPQLLRCLVVSLNARRRRLIRAAAESQAWDAFVCRDAGEFLRAAFKRSVPLVVVDMPRETSKHYSELQQAVDRAKQVSGALLVVAGWSGQSIEEIWARKLGAWSYLSEATSPRGFELVFEEARRALARRDETDPASVSRVRRESW